MKSEKLKMYECGVEYLSSLLGLIEVVCLEEPDVKRRLALFWGKKSLEDVPMLCLHAIEVVCDAQRYVNTLKWLQKQVKNRMGQDNYKKSICEDIDAVISDLLSESNIGELESILADNSQYSGEKYNRSYK